MTNQLQAANAAGMDSGVYLCLSSHQALHPIWADPQTQTLGHYNTESLILILSLQEALEWTVFSPVPRGVQNPATP